MPPNRKTGSIPADRAGANDAYPLQRERMVRTSNADADPVPSRSDGDTAMADTASKATRYRWFVLATMFVLWTFIYADRANLGISLPHIKTEFGLSNAQVGLLASMFAFAYAAAQIPSALIVRKLGVSRVVLIFSILTALSAAACGFVGSYPGLQTARVALGLVEAPIAIAMMVTINNWFATREKGTAIGIFVASTKFAPVIVPPLGAFIIATWGWQHVFYAFAVPSIIMALVWLAFVPDDPANSRRVSRRELNKIRNPSADRAGDHTSRSASSGRLDKFIRAQPLGPLETTREIMSSWTIWGVSLCFFLVQGIIAVILFLLPLYLTEVRKLSIMNVGIVAAAPFVGAVLGNLAGGIISDRIFKARRKPTMMITMASTSIMMWSLTIAPDNVYLLTLQLVITGALLALGYSVFTIYPAPMTSKKSFPIAVSLMNTMGQLGTALAPLAVGITLDHYGWPVVFTMLSLASLTALVVLLTIVEPLPHPPESESLVPEDAS